jgi:oligoribonuclease
MDDLLVWCDLETTGLAPMDGADVILECGFMVTDKWGGVKAERAWLVWDDEYGYEDTVERVRENDIIVDEMHTKSGLWDALGNFGNDSVGACVSLNDLEIQALDWFDHIGVPHGQIPLCGSFLKVWTPKLEQHFHYRSIDISSIKELCRRLNPELYGRIQESSTARKLHRALPDLYDSIAEYKSYYENFFWIGD